MKRSRGDARAHRAEPRRVPPLGGGPLACACECACACAFTGCALPPTVPTCFQGALQGSSESSPCGRPSRSPPGVGRSRHPGGTPPATNQPAGRPGPRPRPPAAAALAPVSWTGVLGRLLGTVHDAVVFVGSPAGHPGLEGVGVAPGSSLPERHPSLDVPRLGGRAGLRPSVPCRGTVVGAGRLPGANRSRAL